MKNQKYAPEIPPVRERLYKEYRKKGNSLSADMALYLGAHFLPGALSDEFPALFSGAYRISS